MGEYADYILNGDDCQECGEHIGDGDGYPRSCAGCGGESVKPSSEARRAKRQRRKKKQQAHKKELLEKTPDDGWTKFSPIHWYRYINGKRLDFWPTTGKFMYGREVFNGQNVDEFIKAKVRCEDKDKIIATLEAQIVQKDVDIEYLMPEKHRLTAYHATEKSMREFAEADLGRFKKIIGRIFWMKAGQ